VRTRARACGQKKSDRAGKVLDKQPSRVIETLSFSHTTKCRSLPLRLKSVRLFVPEAREGRRSRGSEIDDKKAGPSGAVEVRAARTALDACGVTHGESARATPRRLTG